MSIGGCLNAQGFVARDGAAASNWRHRWPTWSAYAALTWSVVYGGLAVGWALGAPGFPFGEADREAADMGSVLYAATAGVAGPVLAATCLLGAAVAVAMLRPARRRASRRIVLVLAWLFAIAFGLVIPDIRLLQNAAYALLFVFVKFDWHVLNQGILVLGGISFAAAALGYRRRTLGECVNCGRAEADERTVRVERWGKIAAWVAFLMPLPYGLTRLAWALGIPLGIDQDPAAAPLGARIGESALAFLAIGGGILALGLIRPWGEVWPRWVPFLAGRRVPVGFPTVLGGLVAIVITVGAFAFVRIVAMGELGLRPVAPEPPTVTGWATGAPGWLWPFWGIALGLAAAAYYYRRRDRCRVCGQP